MTDNTSTPLPSRQVARHNELGQPIGPALDWEPCEPPSTTPMEGRFCRLEAADANRHAEGLFEAARTDADDRMWTYLPYGPFDSADAYGRWMLTTCASDDPLFFAIVDRATGRPTGMASLMRIEPAVGVVEIGHVQLSPRLQRSSAATEAMFLLLRRVFAEAGYRRCEWKCDDLNAPSRRAAERLGFRFEGIFRQATIYKGRNRDTAWYSILDAEWPALDEAFRSWLDESNFDADGAQRRPLSALQPQPPSTAS